MKRVRYYMFILGLLAVSSPLSSQIIYTDIHPDSTVLATVTEVTKSYFIDFDADGTYEFELRHFHPTPLDAYVEIHRNPHGTVAVILDANGHSAVLQSGDEISVQSSTWGLDGYGILHGPWYGGGDKYFGMRFTKGGQTYYCWARVSIPADGRAFTIKDFAYESTPGKAITAGDMGETAVDVPPSASGIAVAQSGTQVTFTSELPLHGRFRIFDILGCPHLTQSVDGRSVTIDISTLHRGMYFMVVESNGKVAYSGKVTMN